MKRFNKICMVLAYALGIVLMLLGIIGLVFGSKAHFALPPILGGIPFLIGWGIIVAIKFAWNQVGSASFSETLTWQQARTIKGTQIQKSCALCTRFH